MAPKLQLGGRFSTRRTQRRTSQPISEINVTALVGVMAVLLMVFMVAAPQVRVGVAIDEALPQAEQPANASGSAPLSIRIDGDGKIFLESAEIGFDEVVSTLNARRESGEATEVSVRADNSASYGAVTKVLVRIKEAGLPVTLITAPVDQP